MLQSTLLEYRQAFYTSPGKLESGSHSWKILEFCLHSWELLEFSLMLRKSSKTSISLRKSLKFAQNYDRVAIPHRSINFIKFPFSSLSFILFSPTASHSAFCAMCLVPHRLFSFWIDMAVDAVQIPTRCFMHTQSQRVCRKQEKSGYGSRSFIP